MIYIDPLIYTMTNNNLTPKRKKGRKKKTQTFKLRRKMKRERKNS